MTLQDIEESKCYGRTDARTDYMKTVYPPQAKFVGGIEKWRHTILYLREGEHPVSPPHDQSQYLSTLHG